MSVCVSKATLAAMGLAPSLPAYGSLCNPFLGVSAGSRAGISCQPGVPCCAGVPLSTFNPFAYPIAAGSIELFLPDLASFTPPNPSVIADDGDLLQYLNLVLIPYFISIPYTIEGVGALFAINDFVVYAPRIEGTCNMVLRQASGYAPSETFDVQPPTHSAEDEMHNVSVPEQVVIENTEIPKTTSAERNEAPSSVARSGKRK